ncbi:MAG: ATP-binding protein [Wujia sp.]
MNERRLRQLNILVIITLVLSAVAMGTMFFITSSDDRNKTKIKPLSALNHGWELYRIGDENPVLVDLPDKVKAKPQEVITISHEVPEGVGDNSVLFFYTEFQNVIVSINEQRIYENGIENESRLFKNAVPTYNMVSLEGAKPGDTIWIQYLSSYKKHSGSLGEIFYGSQGDAVSYMIANRGISFGVALTIFLITALLGLSLLFMEQEKAEKRRAAYGLGFIMLAALWSMLDSPLSQVLTTKRIAVYVCSNILLLVLPMVYMMYLRCFALKRRYAKIFEISIYVYGSNLLVALVFWFVGVCDLATYMVVTKSLIAIGLLVLCILMYLAADTYRDKSIYSNFWSNVILCIAFFGECLFGLFKFYAHSKGLILQVGLFVFAVLLMISIEKTLIRHLNAQRDEALASMGQQKTQAVKTINTSLIYNALNTAISSLKDVSYADSRLLYDTTVFMHHDMEAVHKKDVVAFSEELEYIRAYLGMQKRIHPQLEVSMEDKVVDFKVPYNTIEPIVENAVENGALLSAGRGKIVVRSYERLDCFAIQIVDNGPGISPVKKFYGKQSYSAICKRLKKMSQASVEVKAKAEKGTILTVKIPKDGFIMKE